VLAIVGRQRELLAQDLDVQRDARQRGADIVRDRGGELAERGEPARILELGHRRVALERERDASTEVARDHVRIAIDRAAADLERAEGADFYRRVGTLGRVFLEIESEAYALSE